MFDLDFSIYQNGKEIMLGANTAHNRDALKSAAGTWLNKYAMKIDFDCTTPAQKYGIWNTGNGSRISALTVSDGSGKSMR